MRVYEIRELNNDQLYEELVKAGRELMNLRFSAATNQFLQYSSRTPQARSENRGW